MDAVLNGGVGEAAQLTGFAQRSAERGHGRFFCSRIGVIACRRHPDIGGKATFYHEQQDNRAEVFDH